MQHLHHSTSGSFGPVLLTLIVVLIAITYLRGWFDLRSTSFRTSAWRAFSFVAGLVLIWIAIASPIAALDHELLTAHMLQHLLLMTLAPPLIWLGEPVAPLLRSGPLVLLTMIALAFDRPLRKLGRFLAQPQVCWLAASAVLVIWHVPAVFALGMKSEALHMFEAGSFLAAGLMFWWPVVQPWPSTSTPDLSIILYLFFATIPCDILSGFLVFCDRVVYSSYLSSSHLLGFSALGDQQCAAALMWTCVTIVYLIAGTVVATHLLSPRNYREHVALEFDVRAYVFATPQNVEALHGD
jgi:putative membrane protein